MIGAPIASVGRIVHYQHSAEGSTAAVVVSVVQGDMCRLRCFPPDGGEEYSVVAGRADDPAPGCWNWPPRS